MNDIHYDPFYNSKVDKESFCWAENPIDEGGKENATQEAKFGRFGCDPNDLLISNILNKMTKDYEIDVLLINGDLVGHEIAVKPSLKLSEKQIEEHYIILKDILTSVQNDFVNSYFKNTVILPTIGNNDVKFHY